MIGTLVWHTQHLLLLLTENLLLRLLQGKLAVHILVNLLPHFSKLLSLYTLHFQLELFSLAFLFANGLVFGFFEEVGPLLFKLNDSFFKVVFSLLVDSAHLRHFLLVQLFNETESLFVLVLLVHDLGLLESLVLRFCQLFFQVVNFLFMLRQLLFLDLRELLEKLGLKGIGNPLFYLSRVLGPF